MNDIAASVRRTADVFPFAGYCDVLADAQISVAQTVLRHLWRGATILDFGAGPCDKTSVLQGLGYVCTGCDDLNDPWHLLPGNREKIIEFARNSGIDFRLAAAGEALPYSQEQFDMVMLHDVVEHLHDSPRELLNDLVGLIKPDGLLFITVPNAGNIRKRLAVLMGGSNYPDIEYFYWTRGRWRGHVREYVRADLLSLADYLDLAVIELRACDHMLRRLPAAIRPAYRAVTGLLPGLKDTWALVCRKRHGWAPRRSVAPDLQRAIDNRAQVYQQ